MHIANLSVQTWTIEFGLGSVTISVVIYVAISVVVSVAISVALPEAI